MVKLLVIVVVIATTGLNSGNSHLKQWSLRSQGCSLMLRKLASLVVTGILAGMLIVPVQAAEREAVYSAGSIMLPSVVVGEKSFDVVLVREPSDPTLYSVSQALKIANASDPDAAVYSGSTVTIPRILYQGKVYSGELELVNAAPLQFRLVKINQQKVQEGGEQNPDSGTVPAAPELTPQGYAVLPDGRGGVNYEAANTELMPGFDMQRSLAAFSTTLYPYLRSSTCVGCHNSAIPGASGAQAPLHADSNVELAHDYALTRVNFADPQASKFVVRLAIDRHNCPQGDCLADAQNMLDAIKAWIEKLLDMLPETPRRVAGNVLVSENQIRDWIAADRATLGAEDRDNIIYTSLHELHNEGLTAQELDIVRAALAKALNSVARWAPEIVNPVDVNGKGLLYKFDIRDYWGWNKGVTRLLFGGSDDDLAFGNGKRDYRGTLVSSAVQREVYNYSDKVSWDPGFARTVWERVLHGNVEGAVTFGTIPPYIDGFRGVRSSNSAGSYIKPEDFEWVETAQLIYTLTRPDVYNAIMMIPMTAVQLEDELGVDRSQGMDSYDYAVTFDAITVDSRFLWRARTEDGGFYWKTWDIFSGQLAGRDRSIFDVYAEAGTDIRFPWWANPVPVFVDPQFNRKDTTTWSFVASLAQPFGSVPAGCDPQPNFSGISGFYNCRHFTGTGGLQQSASEIIWGLPNGLQGYMLTGAFNQRRVDAFVNIVRDPRLIPDARDDIATQTGFAFRKTTGGLGGFNDPRLNVGSSCIGCHIDGLNRFNNDLRDWLDEAPGRLPKGPYGVDGWIDNPDTVERVRELYPPSSVIRDYVEQGRHTFLGAMAKIKQDMMLGDNKNLYVEPIIWTVEYVQRKKYRYPQTTSN